MVLADLDLATNPLIIGQVRHMLATAALAVFPSGTVVPQPRGPGDIAPSVVRRAMDHVEAHSDRYVSLTELAEAAGVSARGLQYAFRRYQDTTPARYARRVRLGRAHEDLLRGDPAAGDTVAAIAARWGSRTRSASPPTTGPPTASRRAARCDPDPDVACLDGPVEFTVTDAPDRERFEARDETGTLAGMATYQSTGTIIAYTHTEVDPAFEGRGVGSTLARAVMDDARVRGRTVVPICPFLGDWLGRHPEYADIVVRSTRKIK